MSWTHTDILHLMPWTSNALNTYRYSTSNTLNTHQYSTFNALNTYGYSTSNEQIFIATIHWFFYGQRNTLRHDSNPWSFFFVSFLNWFWNVFIFFYYFYFILLFSFERPRWGAGFEKIKKTKKSNSGWLRNGRKSSKNTPYTIVFK